LKLSNLQYLNIDFPHQNLEIIMKLFWILKPNFVIKYNFVTTYKFYHKKLIKNSYSMKHLFFSLALLLLFFGTFAQNPVGMWKVKGTNPQKQTYTGTLEVKQANTAVYTLDWNISNGTKYGGLGMLRGNNFYVSWGQNIEYGIVVYRIEANGNLDGQWVSKSGYSKLIPEYATKTTDTKNSSNKSSLIGTYQVRGGADKGAYIGTLHIKAGSNAGHFLFTWQIGNSVSNGVGFLNGNEIVVAWGYGEAYGVVHYVMQNSQKAKGTWAIPNYQGILTEDIEK